MTAPPAGFAVALDDDAIVLEHGRLLAGGQPFRLVRLSESGAAIVARWRDGAPLGPGSAERSLARRLLDAGLVRPRSTLRATPAEVTAVVPTSGRIEALARCLRGITATAAGVPVVVVDDGSPVPDRVEAVAAQYGASVTRLPANRGPSAARNAGLAATRSPLVAFVDDDVVPAPGWLERLVAQLADPLTGAAAPRVAGLARPGGIVAAFEAKHSSLDMGSRGGAVGAGRRVPYVPTTTLLVRRDALPAGGFDTSLHTGEDVDLVWRMTTAGWRVIYDPEAVVRHDHRVTVAASLARRRSYARSIGDLARRHPDALPALRADQFTTAAIVAAALGHPATAALLAITRHARIRSALAGHLAQPSRLAARLLARDLAGTATGLAHATCRPWAPLALAGAMTSRRCRRAVAAAYALRLLQRGPLGAVDDVIAALGTWEGCFAARTASPLLPRRQRDPSRARQPMAASRQAPSRISAAGARSS